MNTVLFFLALLSLLLVIFLARMRRANAKRMDDYIHHVNTTLNKTYQQIEQMNRSADNTWE